MNIRLRLTDTLAPDKRPLYLVHDRRGWSLLESNADPAQFKQITSEPVLLAFALDDLIERMSADPNVTKAVMAKVSEFCGGWKVNSLPHDIKMPAPKDEPTPQGEAVPLPDGLLASITAQGSA